MASHGIPRTHHVVACRKGAPPRVEERAVPRPGNGELLLRTRVVGLCGTDLFKLDTASTTEGQVLGHELVGEVVAVGGSTMGFASGDRVAVPHHVACGVCALCRRGAETMCVAFRENLLEPGGFADHVLVKARASRFAARKLPNELSDAAAVFLEPAACVSRGIRRSALAAGATAVVIGAGSMGLLHLLVLKAHWADCRVVMVETAPDRMGLPLALGASACVAPGEPARCAVLEASDGLGGDAVFDTVGGPQTLRQGLALTRAGGSVVLFAHAQVGARADFDLNLLFKHERRVIGTYSGGLSEQQEVFELLVTGRLDPTPLATHTLPLDQFARGVELARSREALKVLFSPAGTGVAGVDR